MRIWRDLAVHRRRAEVDRLVGEVVEVADARGLTVPGVRRLVERIRGFEEGRRVQGLATLAAPEAALPAP